MSTRNGRADSVLIAAGLFIVYLAVGYTWVTHTRALFEPDVLYHADAPRVIWNETSTEHEHGRVVLHPLHVLVTIPIGVPLTALLGSRQLAAVVISAAFAAGCAYLLNVLLRRATSLPTLERVLFVLLMGFSAGHFTFATVPETHVISGFFLALVACQLAKAQDLPLEASPRSPGEWARTFASTGLIACVFASGALVTNVLLAPITVLLRFSNRVRFVARLRAAVVLTATMLGVLLTLYLVQRVAFFRAHGPAIDSAPAAVASAPAPAVSAPPPQPGTTGPAGWLSERLNRELRYVSWGPRRALEVGLATLVFNIYAPRSERYTLAPAPEAPPPSKFPAVRFDYMEFDLRTAGVVGALAWISVVLGAVVALVRRVDRTEPPKPVTLFALAWVGVFFAIGNLYHVYPIDPRGGPNDIFLFAPNLVFPAVFLAAVAYDRTILGAAPWARRCTRAALAIAVLAAVVNTALHMLDLFDLYRGIA